MPDLQLDHVVLRVGGVTQRHFAPIGPSQRHDLTDHAAAVLTDNLERGGHVIDQKRDVTKSMPVDTGFKLLEVRRVAKNLERRTVIAEPRQPQVHSLLPRARNIGERIESLAAVIALRWNRRATEHRFVEMRQRTPISSVQIRVGVFGG